MEVEMSTIHAIPRNAIGGGLAMLLAVVLSVPVSAAPGGSGGDSGGGAGDGASNRNQPVSCRAGKYYSRLKRKCVSKSCPRGQVVYKTGRCVAKNCGKGTVRKKSSGACVRVRVFNGTDEQRYVLAHAAALGGRYVDAITLLTPIAHTRQPRVLNMLGYSNRKLGLIDTGLAYYHRALAINPDFTLARSYLGEGYLQIGRVDLARQQLAEIAKRCGTTCQDYTSLAGELETYIRAKG
jgi:tetratricopeptide (TPR) repeat protein